MRLFLSFLVLALTLSSSFVEATDFYVDPNIGKDDADGSKTRPWKTLQSVIANNLETQGWGTLPYQNGATLKAVNSGSPVKAGDTLFLASGFYGSLEIKNLYNKSLVTIKALPNAKPKFEFVDIRGASNWKLQGLLVSLSYGSTFTKRLILGVRKDLHYGPVHDIMVESCEISSASDISTWNIATWEEKAADGVESRGEKISFIKNKIFNVHHGMSIIGSNAKVAENSIRNFSGDGIRGLGDFGLYENNYIANAYKIDAKKGSDGFQSWSTDGTGAVGKGEVKGVVIRGNTIISRENKNQKFPSPLQGIGCFDGFYSDWIIENNVIIIDHSHGIILAGARNSRIVNNTVLQMKEVKPSPTFIQISPHKDGTAGTGNIVRNNLSSGFDNKGAGIIEDHNLEIKSPENLFVSATATYDLHLLPNVAAINTGTSESAPKTDKDGVARPVGNAYDIGAYEWNGKFVPPKDMGTSESDMGHKVNNDSGTTFTEDGGVIPPKKNENEEDDLVESEVGCGCTSVGKLGTHGEFLFILMCLGFGIQRKKRKRVS